MMVSFVKSYNEGKSRVEFLLVNFDYYDGNEYLAQIFNEEYGFCVCDKYNGIWFEIIHICLGDCIYEMLWHEDVGNVIYSIEQSQNANDLLEERLSKVIDIVNKRIQHKS